MTEASEIPLGFEVSKGLVAKFLLAAIGFAGTIVFARILGPVAFGGFYLLWTLVQISKLPVDGLDRASKKRFSETDTSRPEIVGATGIAAAGAVVACGVGAILFRDSLASFTGLEGAGHLFFLLFGTVVMFAPFQGMLAGTGRISLTIWVDAMRSLLTTPLQLVFVLYGHGAAGMAYGLSLATALTVPVTHYFLRTRPVLPDRTTVRRLWEYARYSVVSASLGKAYDRFDILLLGLLLTPAAVGQYEVAFKLTLPAVLIAEVAGEGLLARVSNLDSKGEPVDVDISNTLSFVSILAIPIFFGSIVLSRELVETIYGPDFTGATTLLVGLALFRLIKTQVSPLAQTINGLDRPDVNMRVNAMTLAINIALGVLLTLRLGAIGVVIATITAEGLRYAGLAVAVKRQVPEVSLLPQTLIEQIFAAVVMAVAVVGVHQFVPVRSWLHLTMLLAIGGAVYGMVLLMVSETLRLTAASILRDAGVP